MLKITAQQFYDRWDTLLYSLREAMFSETNSAFVLKLGEDNHLSPEKVNQVAIVVSDVLTGFLHYDPIEVAREIQERAGLPKPIAEHIAKELERKIFLPLRSDLDRTYAPPKSSNDLARQSRAPNKGPLPDLNQLVDLSKILAEQPAAGRKTSALDATQNIQKPSPLVALVNPLSPRRLAPAIEPANQLPETTAPKAKPPEKPQEPVDDMPFILHEEKPIFKPNPTPEKPSVVFEPQRKWSGAPISKSGASRAKIETPDSKDEPRVVHYSNFRTPLDKDGA